MVPQRFLRLRQCQEHGLLQLGKPPPPPPPPPLLFLDSDLALRCSQSIVDGMLEELSGIDDTAARVKAQANIQQQVFEDLPISNLLTPEWHVGLSDRVAGYEPYGSDFYVIRDDLHSNGEQYTTAVS